MDELVDNLTTRVYYLGILGADDERRVRLIQTYEEHLKGVIGRTLSRYSIIGLCLAYHHLIRKNPYLPQSKT